MAIWVRRPAQIRFRGPLGRRLAITSFDYTQALTDHRVLASIGSVGDAYDNAMAESLRRQRQDRADRHRTRQQLELAVVQYVICFNHQRLHAALGDIPPVEHKQLHAAGIDLFGERIHRGVATNAQRGLQRIGPSRIGATITPGLAQDSFRGLSVLRVRSF